MTIEKSPAPTANSSTAASAHGAKAKGKGGGQGGFGAILDALGADDATALTDAKTALTGADLGSATLSGKDAVTDATAAAQATLDASTLQALNAQLAQLAQAAQTGSARAAVPGDANGTASAEDAQRLARSALGGGKAGLATGAVGAAGADGGDAASFGATNGPLAGGVFSMQALAARDRAKALADAQGAAGASAAGVDNSGLGAGSATAASSNAADSKDNRLLAAIQQLQSASVQADKPASSTDATAFRIDQPAAEHSRNAERQSDANNGLTASATASASPAGYSDTSVNAAATASGTDNQVAEQVKYWISHDIQNAELKLDGLGKDPVQVSISMSGNEANIVFRTDESQARGVLESASAHLRDMLSREGVVLTGVSVGTSGSQQGDSSSNSGRPRTGVRQALVTPAGVSGVSGGTAGAGHSRSVGNSGRALDLFV